MPKTKKRAKKPHSDFTVTVSHTAIAEGFGTPLLPPPLPDNVIRLVSDSQAAKHSANSSEWRLAPQHVARVHKVIGKPDLDPASNEEANELIKASRYFNKSEDGLVQAWGERSGKELSVYMNAPGGVERTTDLDRDGRLPFKPRLDSRGKLRLYESMPVLFWYRLQQLRQNGLLKHGIVVAFNIEALQVTQGLPNDCPSMCDFLVCVGKKRIPFVDERGKLGNAPAHSSAFIYVAGTVNERKKFMDAFGDVGSFMAGKFA